MAFNLGQSDGVAQRGNKIYGDSYVKHYKGADLFLSHYWMLYLFEQPPDNEEV